MQRRQSEIKSGEGGLKIKLDIPFLSAPPPPPSSSAAVSFSICWQLRFYEAVKSDLIVPFGGIVLPFRGWNKFIKYIKYAKTYHCIVFIDFQRTKFFSQFQPQPFILKIFLNFANFSLDILIEYILIKKKRESIWGVLKYHEPVFIPNSPKKPCYFLFILQGKEISHFT